ncbi:MAG: hypothetical protein MR966_03705 [Lachnospiraceae bacterium]|nr:hypothetical protein [Lachnospiraceae bacterium]
MNEMRTDDASAAGQFAFDDDQYTDKELREQKKQFEKQLLELESLLDKDEWSDEDMDCVRSVKESVESYTDAGPETDSELDGIFEGLPDDTAGEPLKTQEPLEKQLPQKMGMTANGKSSMYLAMLRCLEGDTDSCYSRALPEETEFSVKKDIVRKERKILITYESRGSYTEDQGDYARMRYISLSGQDYRNFFPEKQDQKDFPAQAKESVSFEKKRDFSTISKEKNFASKAMHMPSAKAYRDDSFWTKYGAWLLLGALFSAAVFFICYFRLYSVLLVLLLASAAFGLVLTVFRLKRSADEKKQRLTKENDTLKLWNELLEQVNKELGEKNAELKKANAVLEETNGALEGINEVLKGEKRNLDREKRDLWRRIERLEENHVQLEKQMDQVHDENRKLLKKLARMSEVQEQIRVLKMLIKQIGLTNEEIEEILKMTEEVKKDSFSEERLEWYIAEILQVAKGRKESALYKKKKEYFTVKEGELFTALCEAAKDFLITAEVMYDLLQDYGSGCDYSSVCLLASKAMEVETRVRYFDSYKIYLDKQFGTDYKKWPKNMLYCGEPASFCSMGNIRRIVTRCDQEGVSYIRRNFLIYAKQEMFRDTFEDHMEQEIWFQLDCIDSVRLKYRNPAAHSRLFTSEEAKICLCYIVEDEQVLFHIMKAYKN